VEVSSEKNIAKTTEPKNFKTETGYFVCKIAYKTTRKIQLL